ncbi:MAG TPA: sel1 repeat family protein, partial [Chromatiales bacterium]|nr:sel1 repeat family protein [Chromatiales bacterium]HEX22065.1 sel1 repeat family protein [Chromatiales bacterium]
VKQDYVEAAKLWRLAAEQGHVEAQMNLGLMYGKGQGVEQDDVRAYAWLTVATTQGNEVADSSREFALMQLDETQREQAEALAKELVRKYVEPFTGPAGDAKSL